LLCVTPEKALLHAKEFKKLDLPKSEIIHLLENQGAVLASNHGSLKGLFDYFEGRMKLTRE
jgi:hypothetical protein